MEALWAKLGADEASDFHPLSCHCVDVAAVVLALWELALPRASRRRLVTALGGLGDEATLRWLAFWAGLHDLGKASPAFQGQNSPQTARLTQAGYDFPRFRTHLHHSLITRQTLPRTLCATLPSWSGIDCDTTRALACALGGHHGEFGTLSGSHPQEIGTGVWDVARQELIQVLADTVGVTTLPPPLTLAATNHPFFLAFAGLVSVADWIGSAENFFGFAPEVKPEGLAAYLKSAQAKARDALQQLGWTDWSPPVSPMDLSLLLDSRPPRPMQEEVAGLAPALQGPSLLLIEAPTGEGKTEAALFLADHFNQSLGQRGIYVALPTQATANAMFDRFDKGYLKRRYEGHVPRLGLLHGQAMLRALKADEEQPLQSGPVYDEAKETPAQAGQTVSQDWFGYRKRGLLGPLAVGTIDQALVSVLQTRHGFVRLFGLADKTVILDEVHAFDTYTSELLDRLLAWLAALNCSVVLLSATLPSQRRRELLQAYSGKALAVTEAEYPRVTVVAGDQTRALSFAASPQKPVALEWVSGNLTGLVEKLQPLREEGGCVAWVCNTVGQAQEVYLALRESFTDSDVEVRLFHARYPFAERQRREQEALRLYGKDKSHRPKAPRASIQVATQVIEQSLDLDFDLLITEVAPVDLVLQRAGRLHRHAETRRPDWLRERRLWLIEPECDAEGLPDFDKSRYVYGDYILLRSWLELQERTTVIRVPEDVEGLIEAVYTDEAPKVRRGMEERLAKAWADERARRERLTDKACKCLIGKPTRNDLFTEFVRGGENLQDDEDPRLHSAFRAQTRCSDRPSVTMVCLRLRGEQVGVDTREGLLAVDLSETPQGRRLRALVEQGVSLSTYPAPEYLLARDPPPAWRKSALLRYCRAVVFDEEGIPTESDCPLRLDAELGIAMDNPGGR